MIDAGLSDDDLVIDVGAGWTEFDCFLRELGWRGRYFPVDGSLDGTDLEHWSPPRQAEFIVAIEVLEHLINPWTMLNRLFQNCTKLAAITTPNPATTDVLRMDPTHKTPIREHQLRGMCFDVEVRSFYGQPDDSLLAWRKR